MTYPSNRPPDRPTDAAAGIEVTSDFERFAQRNDIFTRAFWDDRIRSRKTDAFFASYRMEATPRRGDGFTQRDFALRNASWLISDLISDRGSESGEREGFQAAIRNDTPVAPMQQAVEDPTRMAEEIKRIANFFGADLCGITEMDDRWLYASRVDTRDFSETPNDLPEGMTSVIVMGHQMEEDLVATYPSALAGAATGREYSHEAAIVMQMAAYIRNLGYEATASMNDTGLVIPYAVKAGLGEYARNQMVITPEFGPRLRFSKIFTNLPLTHDLPQQMGVRAFCDICTKCADACPVKALPYGPQRLAARMSQPSRAYENGHPTRRNALASGSSCRRTAPSACGSAPSTGTSQNGITGSGSGSPCPRGASWRFGLTASAAGAKSQPIGGRPPRDTGPQSHDFHHAAP
ncbi:reductive dehalogenase [Sulfitobacter sediminilitoris]|uniref:reductive dehalogenase n=1 Tax=Sulfitobacter sediminilitoris TaxID=2698830 RepID=UPI003610C7F6